MNFATKVSTLAVMLFALTGTTFSVPNNLEEVILPVTEETRALQLNLLLEKNLQHLDELNSTLQYLGQAIGKGTIKPLHKKDALDWSSAHQAAIRRLAKSYTHPLTESQLHTLSSSIKVLALQVSSILDNKFISVPVADLDTAAPTRVAQYTSLESISKLTCSNDLLINLLKQKADKAGLTTINIVARKLDAFNDRFYITNSLKYIPLATITAATAIHFMPNNWFPQTGTLRDIKSFMGTSYLYTQENIPGNQTAKSTRLTPAARRECRRLSRQLKTAAPTRGIIGILAEAYNDKETYKLGTIVAGVGMWTFSKIPLPDQLETVKNDIKGKIRSKWEQLKGFDSNSTKRGYDYAIKMTLDDEKLVGLESQTAELRKLVKYITAPEIYDRSNANLEKGLLLVGPSRSGKTFAARALHGSINKALAEKNAATKFGFRELKWSDIVWKKDGVQKILEEAKNNAPCVLFIDEIHTLPLQTKEWGGDVLGQFLTGMSGINSESDAKHQVILLGATNHPEMLDFALLQPGRFGTIIHFEKPSYENRKKYFEVLFKHNAIDTEGICIDTLARQTEQCSYGDLEFIIKQARFVARTQAKGVSQEHLQEQVNIHVRSFKTLLPLTAQEKNILALHQAGHALASILLNPENKLESVTILPRHRKIIEKRLWTDKQEAQHKTQTTKFGGLFTYNYSEALKLQDAQEKTKQCMIQLAGPLAEKIVLGSSGSHHHTKDKQKALKYAQEVLLDGLLLEDLSKQAQQDIKQQAYSMLQKLELETEQLLKDNKNALVSVAQELEEKHTLDAESLKKLIDTHR
ncbi:AAA family ATPase [Candidatus Dependentiae bacterium]|nr:AAA family ATPase [Candidatus Dependentiae bacterium]